MKKLMMLVVALLMAIGVRAQEGPKIGKKSPGERIEAKIAKMKEVMAITSEQEAEIRPILEEKQKAMMAFRKANKGNKEMIKAEHKSQREIVKEKLKTILTPEQQQKWKAYKQANKAERRGED